MKVHSYTKAGHKQEAQVTLDKVVFEAELNPELVDLAYRSYLAAGRNSHAKALTRGLVSGGGKKPWRQKGTGRARVGSSRVPNWRGGGVVFGPTGTENYAINLTTKMKRAAIRQALSAQAKDKKLAVIEAFEAEGKVKPTLELLGKIGVSGSILIVVPTKNSLIDRATRNVAGVKAVEAKYLNVYDVLNADFILLDKKSLPVLEAWLSEVKTARAEEPK